MIKLFLINWIFIFLLMTIAFVIYLIIKNPGIIDVFWPISITFTALHAMCTTNWSLVNIALCILLLCWCFRLASYLLVSRIIPKIKEERYVDISKKWKMPAEIGFFLHFQFQGVLAMIVATPFIWIARLNDFNYFTFFSITLIIVGIIGETIADFQLNKFKKEHPGKVCNIGLWNYSRHPNYLFELLVWVGFGVSALNISIFSMVSPLFLFIIMYCITGPITERQSIKSKGQAFVDYQKKTPYFILFK